MDTKNIIKYIILPIIILIFLIGAGSFLYKMYKNNINKELVIEKTDEIKNNLNDLNKHLQTNAENSIKNYENANKDVETILKDDNFVLYSDIKATNYNNPLIIEIGNEKYVKEFPTNYESMSNTIVTLQHTVNKLNKIRNEEHYNFLNTMTNTIQYVEVIQTNVVYLKEEIDKYMKPKLFSYGVGIGLAFEGMSQNKDIFYKITGHGTLYILDSWYVGLELGISYNLYFNPVIGIFAGVKF